MKMLQTPNKLLIIVITTALLNALISGPLEPWLTALFYMAFTIWAYQEAHKGANWFRRALGITALTLIFAKLATLLD